ncbi:MAG: hypothetical protein EBX36_03345 [Planctomycetia bacterium]|nr:hypothetical protein [Planctomycetia bacterium]
MSLPRVVIDLEKLRHINCGLGRYSLHLGRELLEVAGGRFQPVFLLPAGAARYFPGGGFEVITVSPWNKEALRRLYRPLVRPLLPAPRVRVWHVTSQMSKYLPLDDRVPVVLTIHDLNFLHESPDTVRSEEIDRKLADIQRKVDRAAAIVADSAYVAADVAEHVDLGGRPVHVVPLAVSPPTASATARPAYVPAGPFLLSIGNCLPHKNFHALFGLLESVPDARLVIAGKKTTPYGEFLEREVARLRGVPVSVAHRRLRVSGAGGDAVRSARVRLAPHEPAGGGRGPGHLLRRLRAGGTGRRVPGGAGPAPRRSGRRRPAQGPCGRLFLGRHRPPLRRRLRAGHRRRLNAAAGARPGVPAARAARRPGRNWHFAARGGLLRSLPRKWTR